MCNSSSSSHDDDDYDDDDDDIRPEEVLDARVPDYYTVIKNPMDLQSVENKCVSEQYKDPQLFIDDIALMLSNSYVYNKPDSVVGKCTKPLENHFIKLIRRHLPECTYPRLPSSDGSAMNGTMSSESDGHDVSVSVEMFDHDYFSTRIAR
ncbi:hypothetical protein LSH36_20g07088 [Paralvinella palmiformis]|uniref:Bromo domain-containing protein n=1 Tax=Paralvinella palmiformis TaxID=53620 RepID=A0AAD9KAI0_9ANNE|nr:hypothetical protein LSH36_20g07088 [Paralvinella palmiformis]